MGSTTLADFARFGPPHRGTQELSRESRLHARPCPQADEPDLRSRNENLREAKLPAVPLDGEADGR